MRTVDGSNAPSVRGMLGCRRRSPHTRASSGRVPSGTAGRPRGLRRGLQRDLTSTDRAELQARKRKRRITGEEGEIVKKAAGPFANENGAR